MMRKQSAKEETWDGFSYPAALPKDESAKKQPEPKDDDKPAAEAVPAKDDTPQLKNLDSASIAATFTAMAAQAKESQQAFRETLASLNGLIAKCHDAGLEQIGVEHAGFDTLRHYNFEKNGQKDTPAPHVTYALLSIDDARFLIRVHPGNIIDCYSANINKPQPERQFLDDDTFWYSHSANGKISTKSEAKFFQYNLAEKEDATAFMQTVLQTAAVTGAAQELREYDLTARSSKPLGKLQKQMKP